MYYYYYSLHLPVRHCKVYTEGRACIGGVYLIHHLYTIAVAYQLVLVRITKLSIKFEMEILM